ncbi:MAG: Hint domain-containing protein [Pseudomonadota bacterium]
MPTDYDDQFFVLDPANPPGNGTTLNVVNLTMTDQNDDADIDRFDGDSVNGLDVTRSWPGDTVTVNVPGVGPVTYVGTTFYLADGSAVFTPTDGQVLQTGNLANTTFVTTEGPLLVETLGPPCFTPGTLIATLAGPKPVETLVPGDLIVTLDAGPQPLVLLKEQQFDAAHFRKEPRQLPVTIGKDALGPGLPDQPLTVSPQHRMLVRSPVAERMFGSEEILIPAVHLEGLPGVERSAPEDVRYLHVVLPVHAVIFANGAPSETLYLGGEMQDTLTRLDFVKLQAQARRSGAVHLDPARPLHRGARVKRLIERHAKNGKPLISAPTIRSAAARA